MRALAQLYLALDRASNPSDRLNALEDYFRRSPPADAAWALWFLSGQPMRRALNTGDLRQRVAESAELPLWLVEECYHHVGDLSETLALLLPPSPCPAPLPLAQLVEQRLLPLIGTNPSVQRSLLRATWAELDTPQRCLWHKLITGHIRLGVPRALLVRALARLAGIEPSVMEHRLLGKWRPTSADFARLISAEGAATDPARPYPFCPASPLEDNVRDLGQVADWQIEWKWHGLRAQLLRRADEVVLWSHGEEIITGAFPDITEAARSLPKGVVLDGELLAWRGNTPLPLAQLQRRLRRPKIGSTFRPEGFVVFMAYDLLEKAGQDWRDRSLSERRSELEAVLRMASEEWAARLRAKAACEPEQGDLFASLGTGEASPAGIQNPPAEYPLRLSALLPATTWDDVSSLHQKARKARTVGLMLKRRDSTYGAGCEHGAWRKWKIAPLTCKAVLVAAQAGHGHPPASFTDYLFAVWQGNQLVPIAKTHSGLTDEVRETVDAFVGGNITERFGPVRFVKPELVFELAFEGIEFSTRYKAGLRLCSPRIARQRPDTKPTEADTLETLRTLAKTTESS